MIPAVFINGKKSPFIDRILLFQKLYETRTRNTLGRLLGERVILAETGKGKPLARATAVIKELHRVYTRSAWETVFPALGIDRGSEYDWQPWTKQKVLYYLDDVRPIEKPFVLPEGRRHGRVWMEYDGNDI